MSLTGSAHRPSIRPAHLEISRSPARPIRPCSRLMTQNNVFHRFREKTGDFQTETNSSLTRRNVNTWKLGNYQKRRT